RGGGEIPTSTARRAANPALNPDWLIEVLLSTDELVATAMNGKYETRFLGVRLQLLPEVNDVRVDGPRARIVFVSPHFIQEPIARECFRRMRDEVSQQRKFFRREIYSCTRAQNFIAPNVDLNFAELVN